MSFPLDLTITGKPTPRTSERIRSARQPQRPLSANRAKSVKSNIFGGIDDEVKAAKPPSRPVTRVKSAPISKEASRKNASNFVEGVCKNCRTKVHKFFFSNGLSLIKD